MKNRFRVILDSNVLLVSISSKSKYHWIIHKLLKGEFELAISNEILTEYEEIISKKFNTEVAVNIIRMLLLLPNVHKTSVYFSWNLIKVDPDDNKFVDCAIASNANLIVTNDRHFNALKNLTYPKVTVINISEFETVL